MLKAQSRVLKSGKTKITNLVCLFSYLLTDSSLSVCLPFNVSDDDSRLCMEETVFGPQ